MLHAKVPVPSSVVPPAQDLLERVPELRTEDGVDDGIQRRVEVPQPQEDRHQVLLEEVRVDGHENGHYEERQPAQHEGPGDDGQGLGGFPLPLGVHSVARLPLDGVVLGLVGDAAVGRGGEVSLQPVGEGGLLRAGVVGGYVGEGRGGLGDRGKGPADYRYHCRCDPS